MSNSSFTIKEKNEEKLGSLKIGDKFIYRDILYIVIKKATCTMDIEVVPIAGMSTFKTVNEEFYSKYDTTHPAIEFFSPKLLVIKVLNINMEVTI